MRKFRVARCLVDGRVMEYAIFEDGTRKACIEEDEQYGKYFRVDNELNKSVKTFLAKSFRGRVKDAYDTIAAGNGDVLKVSFIGCEQVVYFLDRKVGEELREKFLDGWKDTKFGYRLQFGSKHSLAPWLPLNEDNETIFFKNDGKVKYFDSEESAKEYIDKLMKVAYKGATDIVEGMKDTPGNRDELYQWMDEFEARYGKNSVVMDMIFDMVVGDAEKLKFDKPQLDNYGIEVVQCVVKE